MIIYICSYTNEHSHILLSIMIIYPATVKQATDHIYTEKQTYYPNGNVPTCSYDNTHAKLS